MRLTGSRAYTMPQAVPKMPTGLVEIMEDLTRDVLKNNPPDVYEFCAGHMRKLLDIRDGPSLKRPLTLEEKITRAQEKVKKRGEARWQRYVKEKKKQYNISKVQSNPENIIYLEEIKAKPPVYPELNIEKASEIEISHEPGHANDFHVKPGIKVSTNNNIEDNKEINHDTKKAGEPGMPDFFDKTHLSTNGEVADNSSLYAEQFNVAETDSNYPVSKNEHVDVSAGIKTDLENLQNSLLIKNTVNETTINAKNEELSNAEIISNLKDEFPEKVNSKILSTQETAIDKEIVTNSEQKTGYKANSNIANMGNVVNTTIGVLNIIDEISRSPSQKVETLEGVNDDNNRNLLQTQDEKDFHTYNDVNEKIDSKIISTQKSAPTDKEIVQKSAQQTGNKANNSLSDWGKVVNTTNGVLNIIDDTSRSSSQKAEALEGINYDLLEIQDENNLQADVKEVKDKINSKIILAQEIVPTGTEIVQTSEQETDYQTKNYISDMGKVVNTAIGILNITNESARSQIPKAETLEPFNDHSNADLIQTQDKKNILTNVEQSTETATPKIDDDIRDADEKIDLENEHSECSMTDDNIVINMQHTPAPESLLKDCDIQMDKGIDNNGKENNMNILSTVEDIKKDAKMIINESDSMKLADETKTSECEKSLEPTTTNIFDVVDDSHESFEMNNVTVVSVAASNHQSITNVKNDNSLFVLNDVEVLGSGEPFVNTVIINETGNVHEDQTEGNIIEIRINQVAEALNNEVPLLIDNIKISENSGSPFDSLDRVKNETDIHREEENGTLSNSEHVDYESNTASVNLDDVHNANITSGIKSTSIDESTDGMDNTSLIESGTSDATDDMFSNHANNSNMDLETAAVTIQKVFRSFMFKSRASTFDDNDENISLDEENDKKDEVEFQTTNINKERRGISRMDTVLQTVNEEKSLSLSTDDSSTLSSAATTIQAHVRGFLVRNKLHSNKTASTNSLANSEGHDDGDIDHKNKTILNIHIVPEGGNYLSRDESMLTSMDFSLDGSPPSSLNLHPLGYDKNERRKLKREDAIQSISPPSNNSGKLSEDVDSVKDMLITDGEHQTNQKDDKDAKSDNINNRPGSVDTSPTNSLTIETVIEAHKLVNQESSDADTEAPVKNAKGTLTKQSSDEMDVVTPFEDKITLSDSTSTSMLMHSGEFHDVVLPTKVSRGDASVVSEFKNVLVYFLLWNNS